jgi:hypothetical protein
MPPMSEPATSKRASRARVPLWPAITMVPLMSVSTPCASSEVPVALVLVASIGAWKPTVPE